MSSGPPRWTKDELDSDRLQSIQFFREERLEEPLDDYLNAFDRYETLIEHLLSRTSDLSTLEAQSQQIVTDSKLLEVLRYLAAPPISEDDLKVLAESPSLAAGTLRKRPDDVVRLVATVRFVLDQRRFPWVLQGRKPSVAERNAAKIASAALMAARRVETQRRSTGKAQQESMVKQALLAVGLTEVPRRPIPDISQAPNPGEFCGESVLGLPKGDEKADKGRKADVVVRLWDRTLLALECKVSNSSVNSIKRLNNDAAVKAGTWVTDFGRRHVVPTAVLGGVYDIDNLLDAQTRGLTIIWAHNLKPLVDWIVGTKQHKG